MTDRKTPAIEMEPVEILDLIRSRIHRKSGSRVDRLIEEDLEEMKRKEDDDKAMMKASAALVHRALDQGIVLSATHGLEHEIVPLTKLILSVYRDMQLDEDLAD